MFRSDHVSSLLWLLDLRPGVWRDREKTFCDKIESDSRRFVSYVHSHQQALNLKRKPYLLHKVCTVLYCTVLYLLHKFLSLTRRITGQCPQQCQCHIAWGTGDGDWNQVDIL